LTRLRGPQGELEKVGATAPVKVDVRFVAATHRNLRAMIEDGTFREDLYYRLAVIPLELPPLRNRADDSRTGAALLRKSEG
jgi:two-component system NtrC family response regulator